MLWNAFTRFLRFVLFFSASVISTGALAQVTIKQGWNLLGNGSATPISVADVFNDKQKYTSLWKWNNIASKWAFYSPSMLTSELNNYTQNKGYDVLSSIDAKEGFWVNAAQDSSVVFPVASGYPLSSSDLNLGWNLRGNTVGMTPSNLNLRLCDDLKSASQQIVTAWSWDAVSKNWKFYAPELDAQGGTALTDYITSKNYLAGTVMGNTDGFWLNIGVSGATSAACPVFTPVLTTLSFAPDSPLAVGIKCQQGAGSTQCQTSLLLTATDQLSYPIIPPGNLQYISDNVSVVTVDQSGRITGISAGAAHITVSDPATQISTQTLITVAASTYINQGGLLWSPDNLHPAPSGFPKSIGIATWADADSFCKNGAFPGQTGRLPTLDELKSLVKSNAMFGQGWVYGVDAWSSTTDIPGHHWSYQLNNASFDKASSYPDSSTINLTCVR